VKRRSTSALDLKSTASGGRGKGGVGSVAFGDDRTACPVLNFVGTNTGEFKRGQQMEYVCGLLCSETRGTPAMNQENMQLIGDILGDVDRMIKKRTEQLGWHYPNGPQPEDDQDQAGILGALRKLRTKCEALRTSILQG
jgi:hypothetical protein